MPLHFLFSCSVPFQHWDRANNLKTIGPLYFDLLRRAFDLLRTLHHPGCSLLTHACMCPMPRTSHTHTHTHTASSCYINMKVPPACVVSIFPASLCGLLLCFICVDVNMRRREHCHASFPSSIYTRTHRNMHIHIYMHTCHVTVKI